MMRDDTRVTAASKPVAFFADGRAAARAHVINYYFFLLTPSRRLSLVGRPRPPVRTVDSILMLALHRIYRRAMVS